MKKGKQTIEEQTTQNEATGLKINPVSTEEDALHGRTWKQNPDDVHIELNGERT